MSINQNRNMQTIFWQLRQMVQMRWRPDPTMERSSSGTTSLSRLHAVWCSVQRRLKTSKLSQAACLKRSLKLAFICLCLAIVEMANAFNIVLSALHTQSDFCLRLLTQAREGSIATAGRRNSLQPDPSRGRRLVSVKEATMNLWVEQFSVVQLMTVLKSSTNRKCQVLVNDRLQFIHWKMTNLGSCCSENFSDTPLPYKVNEQT